MRVLFQVVVDRATDHDGDTDCHRHHKKNDCYGLAHPQRSVAEAIALKPSQHDVVLHETLLWLGGRTSAAKPSPSRPRCLLDKKLDKNRQNATVGGSSLSTGRANMREIIVDLTYRPIEELLELIDEPNRAACKRLLSENHKLFEETPGSSHNHQAWKGGYIDHITDGMNILRVLYEALAARGRPFPFSLSDVMLVFYLHDLEKPWAYEAGEGDKLVRRAGMETKEGAQAFRLAKAREHGIVLTPDHEKGIRYAEGIVGGYSPYDRVTIPLGAFCHMGDHWSARGEPDYPKVEGDEWLGAGRYRMTVPF